MTDQWLKYAGNPVLGGDLGTCFDISVSVADGAHRMWFSWRPRKGIGYAESADGLHWSPLPEVVLGADPDVADDSLDVTRPYVLADGDGYTMWYSGHSADQVVIGRAVSADGLHWTRTGTVLWPELAWEKAAVMCPSVLRDETGVFHLWYSGGERYEPDAIGYATSPDGVAWMRVGDGPVLTPVPGSSWERDRVAGAHVFHHNGWLYAAYIGFANGFEDSAIGFARSAEGISWQRHAGNPVLTRGGSADFDAINVYKPFVVIDGDLWRMWFNASAPRTPGLGDPADADPDDRMEQIGYADCRFVFQPDSPSNSSQEAQNHETHLGVAGRRRRHNTDDIRV